MKFCILLIDYECKPNKLHQYRSNASQLHSSFYCAIRNVFIFLCHIGAIALPHRDFLVAQEAVLQSG